MTLTSYGFVLTKVAALKKMACLLVAQVPDCREIGSLILGVPVVRWSCGEGGARDEGETGQGSATKHPLPASVARAKKTPPPSFIVSTLGLHS